MSTRSSGLLISITSVHGPSPSAPVFTNLKIQATHPPLVRERTQKYPTGRRTPNLAAVPVTSWYTPGSDPVTFEVDGFRFGCALCIEVCFPELFAEYERLQVDCVLLSTYSRDPEHRLMACAHAATNCYWVSVAVPAQCSSDLPSMVVGPNGSIIFEGAAGRADLVLSPLDPAATQFEIALRHARPWRARARTLRAFKTMGSDHAAVVVAL